MSEKIFGREKEIQVLDQIWSSNEAEFWQFMAVAEWEKLT